MRITLTSGKVSASFVDDRGRVDIEFNSSGVHVHTTLTDDVLGRTGTLYQSQGFKPSKKKPLLMEVPCGEDLTVSSGKDSVTIEYRWYGTHVALDAEGKSELIYEEDFDDEDEDDPSYDDEDDPSYDDEDEEDYES